MSFILSGLTTFLLGSQVHKVLQYMLDLKVPVSLLLQHEIIMQQHHYKFLTYLPYNHNVLI